MASLLSSFIHLVHIPQLAVTQLWVKEVPWNPVCPPNNNVKNKEMPLSRSVSVALLWLALTISSPEHWTYATTAVSLINVFDYHQI